MALAYCPECKKEIVSEAKSCPHCSYKPKSSFFRKYAIYAIILIVGLYLISLIFRNLSKNIINDSRTYEQSWRSPTNEEFDSITQLMIKKHVQGCSEYHIKEIEIGEFVIACTTDGENWLYYVAWPKIEKIHPASVEMERRLKPPY